MENGISYAAIDADAPERLVPLRRMLGVTSFGLNQFVLRPGQRGRIHTHAHQEEVYLVLRGTLTLLTADGERDLGEGDLARVAPDVRRQLVNRGPATCVLIALGGTGEHEGRDGVAYEAWDATEGRAPQEVPLPEDLPASELR